MLIELADIEEMFAAYLECALWSGTDTSEEDCTESLDANYDIDDIAEETLATLFADCIHFLSLAESADLAIWVDKLNGFKSIGNDFCLTRNHHGAGFWDHFYGGTPEEAAGDRLTEVAHSFGNSDLYVGDDGLLYV